MSASHLEIGAGDVASRPRLLRRSLRVEVRRDGRSSERMRCTAWTLLTGRLDDRRSFSGLTTGVAAPSRSMASRRVEHVLPTRVMCMAGGLDGEVHPIVEVRRDGRRRTLRPRVPGTIPAPASSSTSRSRTSRRRCRACASSAGRRTSRRPRSPGTDASPLAPIRRASGSGCTSVERAQGGPVGLRRARPRARGSSVPGLRTAREPGAWSAERPRHGRGTVHGVDSWWARGGLAVGSSRTRRGLVVDPRAPSFAPTIVRACASRKR